jgi:hypothetical protein
MPFHHSPRPGSGASPLKASLSAGDAQHARRLRPVGHQRLEGRLPRQGGRAGHQISRPMPPTPRAVLPLGLVAPLKVHLHPLLERADQGKRRAQPVGRRWPPFQPVDTHDRSCPPGPDIECAPQYLQRVAPRQPEGLASRDEVNAYAAHVRRAALPRKNPIAAFAHQVLV